MGMKISGSPITWKTRIQTTVLKSISGVIRIIQNMLAEVRRNPTAMTLRGSNSAAQDSRYRHQQCQCKSRRRERHAGAFGGIPKLQLEKLRNQNRGSVQHHAQSEIRQNVDEAKLRFLSSRNWMTGLLVRPFTPDHGNNRDDGDGRRQCGQSWNRTTRAARPCRARTAAVQRR